ncbi:MAG TPA: type II secretion system protein [Patescibacteria group bacterium]|nr:type II secretion system protein [Patescibacteria group bacterium]
MTAMFGKLHRGFTLIELIIVMAIMAILTAMIAGNFQTSRIKALDARRKSDLKQIQTALETYLNDNAIYPPESSGKIVACGSGASPCAWGEDAMENSKGTIYMAKVPGDVKQPTMQYLYVVSSDQRSYQLFARLENDQDKDNVIFSGKQCGSDAASLCTYGVSSSNTTPSSSLP